MAILTFPKFHHSDEQNQLTDIIVFSHLRWEFVKQRPQHLLERIAKEARVLFVEEPIPYSDRNEGTANIIEISDSLQVIQPRIEGNDSRALKRVVSKYSHLKSKQPVVWLYSAAFLPVLDYLPHSLVVYDCMDELSAFKGAPAELIELETELLKIADVVFTGGKSLFESKQKFNDNIYCFPSSVDSHHFASAFDPDTEIPADIARISHPIVGYYGVIDERIDLNLLSSVAAHNPDISFVMIGPVAKIAESDLPTQSNIQYLGPKKYQELPNYLKAFDIAMMPFALNKSTRFISPTKTLEYMAALKPIISTPIYDVKRDYSHEVKIIDSVQEFNSAISLYLQESAITKKRRIEKQQAVIARTSWDTTAAAMKKIITNALGRIEREHDVSELPVRATYSTIALETYASR